METISINRRAEHDYEIGKRFEAGIKLTGPEVKSVKSGGLSLTGGFVHITPAGEAYLTNVTIRPYAPARNAQTHYNQNRDRKLLLHRKEIFSLIGERSGKAGSIIPLSVYLKGGIIKIELGIGRGRKKYDKRETIKQREMQRSIGARLRQSIGQNHE